MKLEDIDRRIAEWKDIMVQAKARVDSWTEVRQEFAAGMKTGGNRKVSPIKQTSSPSPSPMSLGDVITEVVGGCPPGVAFTSRRIVNRVKEELKQRDIKFTNIKYLDLDKKIAARTQQVLYEITTNKRDVGYSVVNTGKVCDGGKNLKVYQRKE